MAKTSVLTILFQLAKKGNADQETIQGLAKLKSAAATAGLAFGALATVGYTLNQVYQNTAQVFIDYAAQVRDLSRDTGMSADQSSRMIQMADDAKVSYDSLTKALWFAAKNGVQPNIETISRLADEYVSLQDPVKQAELLTKNFGKGGAEMGKLLELGSAGIEKLNGGINQNLILTEKAVIEARRWEIAQDNFNDTIEATKVAVGQGLIGVLDGSTVEIEKNAQAIFKAANGYNINTNQLGRYTDAQIASWEAAKKQAEQQWILANNTNAATQSTVFLSEAARDSASAQTENADAMERAAQEAEQLADKQAQVMDVAFQLQDALNSYNEAMMDVDATQKEAQITWDQAQKDYEKGLLTKNDLIAAEQQYNTTMAETGAQAEAAAARHQEAMNRIVFSILQAQAAVDGLSVAESKALLNIGVKLNLIDQETADLATQMVNDFGKIEGGIREADGTLYKFNEQMYIARGYQGTYRYNFIIHTTGGVPNFGFGGGGSEEIITNTGRGGQLIGFAEGGWLSDGWKVVGEEGYEYISPQGYAFTHEQSKALELAGLVPGQKFAVGGDLMGGGASGRRNSPISRLSGLGRRRVSSSSSTESTDTASIAGASQQIAEVAETTAQNSASAQQDFVRVTESSLRAAQASNQSLIEEVQKLNSNITVLQDQTVRAVRESTQAVMR